MVSNPDRDIEYKNNNTFHLETELKKYNGELNNFSFSFDCSNDDLYPKRNWCDYNEAQTNEYDIFDELLYDLCETITDSKQNNGRPRKSSTELAYYAVKKLYLGFSSRRAKSLFPKDAPHFNMISRFLMRDSTKDILQELIKKSAIPLAEIESDFAIDSTGFRCSSFSEYCKYKYNAKKEHNWLKAHICCGVKTNIVTSIEITDNNVHDIHKFESLVRETAKGFNIKEMTADKAYISRKNYDIVDDVGGMAYIPFRSNQTGKAKGSKLYKRAFLLFQLNREEFDKHYHKRSNVESTIGAIKKKFGETLKSRSRVAQENELLCKILAFNITMLIRALYEYQIEIMEFNNQ